MNFEDFLNEDAKSAMQAAHAAHEKQIEAIHATTNGSERAAKLKAAHDAHERRKTQIRKNLQTH